LLLIGFHFVAVRLFTICRSPTQFFNLYKHFALLASTKPDSNRLNSGALSPNKIPKFQGIYRFIKAALGDFCKQSLLPQNFIDFNFFIFVSLISVLFSPLPLPHATSGTKCR